MNKEIIEESKRSLKEMIIDFVAEKVEENKKSKNEYREWEKRVRKYGPWLDKKNIIKKAEGGNKTH